MNALAHAIAPATPIAMHATSDVAKTREGKGPHHTTPQGIWSWLSPKTKASLSLGAAATLGPRRVLPAIGLGGSTC